MFTSTFANMMIAGLSSSEVAAGLMNLLFIMMFAFCGYVASLLLSTKNSDILHRILAGPDTLPGFWIFMYRVNPFTYVVEGIMSTTIAKAPIHCADNEWLYFQPPANTSCDEYMAPYIESAGGYLLDPQPNAAGQCGFCTVADTDAFLAGYNLDFNNRWRDFGFMWAFCIFNIAAAVGLYWLARVPKNRKVKKE
jgi:ATP-binding cassette, subfamily G (WHITE), member 2, PDR